MGSPADAGGPSGIIRTSEGVSGGSAILAAGGFGPRRIRGRTVTGSRTERDGFRAAECATGIAKAVARTATAGMEQALEVFTGMSPEERLRVCSDARARPPAFHPACYAMTHRKAGENRI